MTNYLPVINNVYNGLIYSRNVYEGYQRGFGLQHCNLSHTINNDPLYKEALRISNNLSIITEYNRMNLFLLIKFFIDKIPFGHIVEFGSYKGGNVIFMGYIASILYPGMNVYALDTYEGIPDTDNNIDYHNKGDFNNNDYDSLQRRLDSLGLNNVILVKGLFEDTALELLNNIKDVSIAHIDCDIYSSVKYSYNVIKPYLVDGSYIVFDDGVLSSCLGATQAIEEDVIRRDCKFSEQIYPHYVFRHFKEVSND